jgi:hypothetical protein
MKKLATGLLGAGLLLSAASAWADGDGYAVRRLAPIIITGRAHVPMQIFLEHPSAASEAAEAHEALRAELARAAMPSALRTPPPR